MSINTEDHLDPLPLWSGDYVNKLVFEQIIRSCINMVRRIVQLTLTGCVSHSIADHSRSSKVTIIVQFNACAASLTLSLWTFCC